MEDTVELSSTGEASDHDDVVVDATAGGVTLLAANPGRKSALITNVGVAAMRITTDGSAPTASHGKRLEAGGSLALSSPFCPTKAVKAIRETGTSTAANASEVS